MSLISVVVVLIVIGMVLWAVNHWLPIDPKFKTIINVVVIVFVALWLLRLFVPGIADINVGP